MNKSVSSVPSVAETPYGIDLAPELNARLRRQRLQRLAAWLGFILFCLACGLGLGALIVTAGGALHYLAIGMLTLLGILSLRHLLATH